MRWGERERAEEADEKVKKWESIENELWNVSQESRVERVIIEIRPHIEQGSQQLKYRLSLPVCNMGKLRAMWYTTNGGNKYRWEWEMRCRRSCTVAVPLGVALVVYLTHRHMIQTQHNICMFSLWAYGLMISEVLLEIGYCFAWKTLQSRL